MMTTQPTADGRAVKTRSMFKMDCGVAINIKASPKTLWKLLTTAQDFPRWNSTVTELTGNVALGDTVKLRTPLAPKRVFALKVVEFEPESRMVWADGNAIFKGVRTYTLAPQPDGTTTFTMVEVNTGIMLPMIAPSLPDFAPSFETYAADLKREAERAGRNGG